MKTSTLSSVTRPVKMSLLLVVILICSASLKAAVWTSAASGAWNSGSSWTLVSGTPAAAYPTTNDFVTITTHTINIVVTAQCTQLTINAGTARLTFNPGQSLVVNGNFTNNGTISVSGTAVIYFSTSGTIPNPTVSQFGTMTGTYQFRFRPNGNNITVATGSLLYGQQLLIEGLSSGGTVTNRGVTYALTLFQISGGANFINGANGWLDLQTNVSILSGTFNATGTPNTVNYQTAGWNVIQGATYHHLYLSHTGAMATKFQAGHITTNGDFIIATNVRMDCQGWNFTCNGNWTNNNNTANILNPNGTFTFGGTSPNIKRFGTAEVLGNVVIASTGNTKLNAGNTAGYTGNLTCRNLTFQSGTLDMNSTNNYTVTLTGNMINTGGSFNEYNGLFHFNGTVAQTISGNTMTFTTLRVTNAAGVSNTTAQNLSGTLTVALGTFTANTANFTLLSNATTGITARVAALTTGSVAGNRWVVQRRILTSAPSSTTPYWADFSSPMTAATTLSDWDNEMYLSAVGGADGTACCPTFYSVQQWNNGGGNYSNVTSLIPLVPGYGYSIWTASDLNTLNAFTFDTRGTLNQGTITKAGLSADYYLMGNPYPSQILFSSLTRTSVGNYFWILDETLQDYAFWDGALGTGTGKLNGSGGVINSSQGFMVQCTAGGGSLGFTEASKTTSNVTFVRQPLPANVVKFHFNHDNKQVGMENLIHFVAGLDRVKKEMDIPFPKAPFMRKRYETKMLNLEGKGLCKNTLSLDELKHEVPVVFTPAEAGNYSFNIEGLLEETGYSCVMLEDQVTGTFTELTNSASYSFDCNDAQERHFILHFSKDKESINCAERSNVFAQIAESASIASKVYHAANGISVLFTNTDPRSIHISMYNSLGELISTQQYIGGNELLLERPAESGIYFITLTRDGKTESHKVVVQ